jgi:hypothetical protein|tara:strand:+ start:8586 stop:9248 length:663 start_codon:yes stop_codon:yes gene_type:complete
MPIGAGAVIGIGASILGGVMGASSAKKAAQAAAREKARLQNKLSNLEKNRQDVVNPYEDFTNLSGMITNPFANLGVATGAAEIKIEEADVSLANTLDTMRATGASAGGATALAQAALRSKKGVAASIEQQEKSNQDKAAAGEQRAQQQRMSEEQRMQQAGASGKQFVFGATEQREVKEMDRTYAEMMSAEQDRAQAEADKTGAVTGAIGSIASIGGGMLG